MITNTKLVEGKPRINQQISEGQQIRNKSLMVALTALSVSGLTLSGSVVTALIAGGVIGSSLVVFMGPHIILSIAVLGVLTLIFAVIAARYINKAVQGQKKAIDAELELFTPWYHDNPKIACPSTTEPYKDQVAKDLQRQGKVVIQLSQNKQITYSIPDEMKKRHKEALKKVKDKQEREVIQGKNKEEKDAILEKNQKKRDAILEKIQAEREKWAKKDAKDLAEKVGENNEILDQCHQGAMAEASRFLAQATLCNYREIRDQDTITKIKDNGDRGTVTKIYQSLRKAKIKQSLIAKHKSDTKDRSSYTECDYACEVRVLVDLDKREKKISLPIKKKGELICDVKVIARMNGTIKKMCTGADFLTQACSRFSTK